MVCDKYIVTYAVYDNYMLCNRMRKGKLKMVLGKGQYYCVSLCEELCSIQLTFLLHGKNHSAKQRRELFQYIQSKIELFMDEFMKASTKPKAYIPCYYKNCTELHVELQLLCDGDQHCPSQEEPLPDDYYHDLFTDHGMYIAIYVIIFTVKQTLLILLLLSIIIPCCFHNRIS